LEYFIGSNPIVARTSERVVHQTRSR